MKMKLMGFLAFALLSISILSYGLTGSAYAQTEGLPLSVSSELPSYANGDTIVISGMIKTLAAYTQSVTIVVVSPDGNIVTIAQVIPNTDGSFSTTVKAGGTMSVNGDYEIRAQYGAQKITNTFIYTGGSGTTPVVVEPEPVVVEPEPVVVEPEPVVVEPEPVVVEPEPEVQCGAGTHADANGICQLDTPTKPTGGGGCLIATAAYGSELAPQVQFLREIRDNTVMSTSAGASFMTGFNQLYYSFSPTIADYERENPMFQEAVRAFITPMVSTLSIMTLADTNSETDVLGLGISVIMLNLGMYIAAPAFIGIKSYKHFKSRK